MLKSGFFLAVNFFQSGFLVFSLLGQNLRVFFFSKGPFSIWVFPKRGPFFSRQGYTANCGKIREFGASLNFQKNFPPKPRGKNIPLKVCRKRGGGGQHNPNFFPFSYKKTLSLVAWGFAFFFFLLPFKLKGKILNFPFFSKFWVLKAPFQKKLKKFLFFCKL